MKPTPETLAALDSIIAEHGELNEETAPKILVQLCKKLERERDEARAEIETMREVMKEAHETSGIVNIWLKSCIECKDWSWDADQHEAAKGSLDFANQALAKLQPYITK